MSLIHPTAMIDSKAQLGKNVAVGPYSIIGPDVILGENIKIHSHVVIDGQTTIGENTEIFPFCSIGTIHQDIKNKDKPTTGLVIGKNNTFREYTTLQPGSHGHDEPTTIGDNCYFLLGVHVAHDCHVGNNVIMTNNATLGGHVTVGDHTQIGGFVGVHQFCRIGSYVMIGAMSKVVNDVIDFALADGNPARLHGLNIIGLQRKKGLSKEELHTLRKAYHLIFENDSEGLFDERVQKAKKEFSTHADIQKIISFIEDDTKKNLCHPEK